MVYCVQLNIHDLKKRLETLMLRYHAIFIKYINFYFISVWVIRITAGAAGLVIVTSLVIAVCVIKRRRTTGLSSRKYRHTVLRGVLISEKDSRKSSEKRSNFHDYYLDKTV